MKQHLLSKEKLFFLLYVHFFLIRQNRNTGNNIFGTDAQETQPKAAGTIAGQYKQTQMKSNIFGSDEPTSTRQVSDKNRSNIFGVGDDDQNKRQTGGARRGKLSYMKKKVN